MKDKSTSSPAPQITSLLSFALALLLSGGGLHAAGLTIVSVERLANNGITIVVDDPDATSTSYVLQASISLAMPWGEPTGVIIGAKVGTRTTLTVPGSAATARFFRVVGLSGTAEDPDDDGLSSTFENTGWRVTVNGPLYTSDPGMFDTDGDGFSDGVEFAYGTNPRSSASFPDQTTLPSVEFAEPQSRAIEGSGVHTVALQLSPPFTGTVSYSVNARSTASAPGDFQALSGSVNVSGSTALIPISLVNNSQISAERLIILDLETGPPGTYRRGGRATHVICLSDNDCYYNGTLFGEGGERNFRLRVLRSPSGTSTAFVAGSADGLTAPAGVGGSQSDGIIPSSPQTVWDATGEIDTASRFRAISPLMPLPAAGDTAGLFASTAQLRRILTLDATNPASIKPEMISGNFTEVISSALPTKTYLNTTTNGSFVLIRDLPHPADVASEFQP